jgi:DNA-binding IscR family transcriptional regulator
MWSDVRDAILGVLDNTTIAELAERDRAAQPAGARYTI